MAKKHFVHVSGWTYANFILSLPVLIVGFVYQWARDMFNRGRTFYDMFT